jgi:hypothetical protein
MMFATVKDLHQVNSARSLDLCDAHLGMRVETSCRRQSMLVLQGDVGPCMWIPWLHATPAWRARKQDTRGREISEPGVHNTLAFLHRPWKLDWLHCSPLSHPLPIHDSIYSTKTAAPVSCKWSGTRVHPLFLVGYRMCAIGAYMPAYEREAPACERERRESVGLTFSL